MVQTKEKITVAGFQKYMDENLPTETVKLIDDSLFSENMKTVREIVKERLEIGGKAVRYFRSCGMPQEEAEAIVVAAYDADRDNQSSARSLSYLLEVIEKMERMGR